MNVEIVAGLSLRNLKPRVWDASSPYYLPNLSAVMVSYADFERMSSRRAAAMEMGLRTYLEVGDTVKVYLDNGSFYQLTKGGSRDREAYEEFIEKARPDWYAIPQDYIPTPLMTDQEQLNCLELTMAMNRSYRHNGYVPVIHISRVLGHYIDAFLADSLLTSKPYVALGGIVPNLLRAPKAMAYTEILESLREARSRLADRQLHVFGLGGTATVHLAALLGVDSADSSGWRNRAARGIVQLPGRGDRVVADLGKWRGRVPNDTEWEELSRCTCPACRLYGAEGLERGAIEGFCNRAAHNLWTLLDEVRQIEEHMAEDTYDTWCMEHLENSTYKPLIELTLRQRRKQA